LHGRRHERCLAAAVVERPGHKQGCAARPTPLTLAGGRRPGHPVLRPELSKEEFAQIIDYFVSEYTAARIAQSVRVCNNC